MISKQTRGPERFFIFWAGFAWVNTALSIGPNGVTYMTIATFTVGGFSAAAAFYAQKARKLEHDLAFEKQITALKQWRTNMEGDTP